MKQDPTPALAPSFAWQGLLKVVAVNLFLGIPGIVPIWLAYYYLSVGPLATLGLTQTDPNENDGMAVVAILVFPIVGGALLGWFLTGRAIRPHVNAIGSRWFWPASIVAAAFPTALLILASLAT